MNEGVKQASWRTLLQAIVFAVLIVTVVDTAIQFKQTPLGWSAKMTLGIFAFGSLFALVIGGVTGLLIGLPVGRLLARADQFRPVNLVFGGALIGALVTILGSALGNTSEFMVGRAFWQGLALNVLSGGLVGLFWFFLEARIRSDQTSG